MRRGLLDWSLMVPSEDHSTVSSAYRAHKVGFQHIRTGDPATRRMLERARKVAPSDLPVMVVGETGTGKNLLAQAIHNAAGNRGPFVAVGPADLPGSLADSVLFGHRRGAFTGADRDHPGLIEGAAGGTLFLDELLELDDALQSKLLGVVEYRKFRPVGGVEEKRTDARLVVGIQGDPDAAVAEGRLRADLYYRLKGAVFRLPPLRERGEDAVLLAREFTEQAAKRMRAPLGELAADAVEAIRAYAWPGNLRELKRVTQVAVLDAEGGPIHAAHLGLGEGGAAPRMGDLPPSLRMDELEPWAYRQALARTGGNRREAAKVLGVSEATLYRKLQAFGLE